MQPYPILFLPYDLKGGLTLKEAIDAVGDAFKTWSADPALNLPRRLLHIASGVRTSVHQGAMPPFGATGIMVHCERLLLSRETQGIHQGLPVTVLYDSETGELKALLCGEITCA